MRTLATLALVCAVLLCGCATPDLAPAPDPVLPVSGAVQAEPRGIVGETCPPALAAKGYC